MYRRHFLSWVTAFVALPSAVRASVRRARARDATRRTIPSQAQVRALGSTVLPSELGQARTEIASDAFWRWMDGYRPGAELLHPYGSPRISYTPPSPVPTWTAQLAALDRAARAKHGTGFAGIDIHDRQVLVQEALAAYKSERLPSIDSAPHIALGLLAHFYASSEATDLCYRAQIGRNTCRPLVHNGRKPLPVASS
jgi:hypothetical protein